MIDTVIIRIHEVGVGKKNQHVYDALFQHDKGNKFYQKRFSTKNYIRHKLNFARYGDSGKERERFVNVVDVSSSHYTIAYSINYDYCYAEFNFSVPKLLYGSNVMQYVPYPGSSEHFDITEMQDIDCQADLLRDNLELIVRWFLKEFIDSNTAGFKTSLRTVEILRFDLCYNLHFRCKQDALTYLNYLKDIKKKYIRNQSNSKMDYGTTVFFKNRDYSCKIYHKGTEYKSAKGERNHHRKINRVFTEEGRGQQFFVDPIGSFEGLQNYADRILRYEMTFRSPYLSMMYRKKVAREGTKVKEDLKGCYKIYHNNKSKEQKDRVVMTKWEYKKAKMYEKFINQSLHFYLEVPEENDWYNEFWNEPTEQPETFNTKKDNFESDARLSGVLMFYAYKKFKEFIKDFTVSEYIEFNDWRKKAMEYNNVRSKGKVNINKIQGYLLAMNDGRTLDDLVDLGVISRATKYNVLKTLVKLGYDKNPMMKINIQTELNYKNYYSHIQQFRNFLPQPCWLFGLEKKFLAA